MSTTYHQYLITDGKSGEKFWEVQVVGNQMQIRYGKVGQDKSWTTKELVSPEAALKEAKKKAAAKMKKGYEEVQEEDTRDFKELFGELRSLVETQPDMETLEKVARAYTTMQDRDRERVRTEVDAYLFEKVEKWGNKAIKEVRIMLSPCSKGLKKALLKSGSVRTHPREDTFSNKHVEDAVNVRAGAWLEAYYDPDYRQLMDHTDHGKHSDGTPIMYMSLGMIPPHDADYYGVDILSTKMDPMVVHLDETGRHMMDIKPFSKSLNMF